LLVGAAALVTRAQLRRIEAAEDARRESDGRLLLVADSVPALIAYVDRKQRFRYSNRTYEEWYGFPHERMQDRSMREVFGDDAYEAHLRSRVERVLAGERMSFEYALGEGDGARFLQVTYAPHLGATGEVLGFYVLASDITAIKLAEQHARNAARELSKVAARLEFLSQHDVLTGLPNRAVLHQRVAEAVSLARRRHKSIGVLFVDLDQFKHVNDSAGHDAGDELLKWVAGRLREAVRQEDMVARLGGDEFCVLLQDIAGPADAGAVAQKLLAALADPCRIAGEDVYVSASIGIACLPQDGDDMLTLIKNADVAMYRAKESGRNNFQFFSADAHRGTMGAAALTSQLRHALPQDEFVLHYQPRVEVPSGRLVAVEALLRWNHPERGLLAPSEFLQLAEDSGLIVSIGQWVLREACAQARRWSEAGLGEVVVGVNLSMRQLRSPELAAQVQAALEGNGLPASRLELEITESMAMEAPERTEATLQVLSALGVRLALDDFGTGHSALHYLKRFPIDVLKIDQSFIAGLPGDRQDAAIARTVVDLAMGLGLDVVAEGVRTPEQRDFLAGIGCRLCQGELFGESAPPAAIEDRLRGGVTA
ncbi:MAG: EAL domain-containing protein, partial [Candidatus Parcubacteria bacterium]|nr:EAL domain-containing protein [Burkholderiales bacterium]